MPTSSYQQIPFIIEAVLESQPSSILEIGIGCGKYGVLLREYLDVWNHYLEPWGSRHTVIDGIEIHELYKDSPGWHAYDKITIGNAVEIVPMLENYDLMLMVDVLEHFTLEEGTDLLRLMLSKCNDILIAIPTVFIETIEVWDNPYEIHKCAWTLEDFEVIGSTKIYKNDDSIIVKISK